jgi:two-component system chemotaxis response regulator CheY
MPYQFENASVLVVDDMKPMLALTASTLKIFGFKNVYTASNAEEAFKLFCLHNPDIILTDWLIEPYDGIELIQQIRRSPMSPNQFVPIILMTGYSAKIRVLEARDRGATEFLAKPFSAQDLYVRIEQLIEKPRKFVDAKQFFGPDRRRRRADYNGPKRRKVERTDDSETVAAPTPQTAEETRIETILKRLKKNARDSQK